MSVRRSLKSAAEGLLAGSGFIRLSRRWHRRRCVVLAYHNILPDGAPAVGDRSLHLSRGDFIRQLDRLSWSHRIADLEELLANPFDPSATQPRAAITFDDAYRGALEVGLPELTERGWPATVFVAPGTLGDRAFWWDLLADSALGEPDAGARPRALELYRGLQDEVLRHLIPSARTDLDMPSHSRSATEHELERAMQDHNVSFGVHTWNHPNLTRLEAGEIITELERSLTWLEDRFPRVLPWLAYPYGLRSREVEALLTDRLAGGLTLEGGLVPRQIDPESRRRVPRVNIPAGVSLRGFDLRAAGILS